MPDKYQDGLVQGGVVRRRGVMVREKRRSALCSSFEGACVSVVSLSVCFSCQDILSESFRRGVGRRGVGCMRLRGGLKEVSDQLRHQMWGPRFPSFPVLGHISPKRIPACAHVAVFWCLGWTGNM